MTTFVLIPGAWLGGWAWSRVTPLLRAAGHEVYPATLTGLGERAHLGTPETDLATHVRDVAATLEYERLEGVVLVGHSYGGIVAAGVAERVPERIGHLVYVASAPPPDGVSLFDLGGPDFRAAFEAAARAGGDGWRVPFPSNEVLKLYFGEHGLSAADRRWLRERAVGHPIATFAQPLAVRSAAAAALPRTHVRCSADPGPPAVLPGQEGWGYAELCTGHWPMVTRPSELATLLTSLDPAGDMRGTEGPKEGPSEYQQA